MAKYSTNTNLKLPCNILQFTEVSSLENLSILKEVRSSGLSFQTGETQACGTSLHEYIGDLFQRATKENIPTLPQQASALLTNEVRI